MRQAIQTRFLNPTNSRGSRIKAIARKAETSADGRVPELSLTDNWDHAQGVSANHARAAKLLAAKLGWAGLWVGGGLPDNSGYVFVNVVGLSSVSGAIEGGGIEDRDWFTVAERASV